MINKKNLNALSYATINDFVKGSPWLREWDDKTKRV